MAGRLDTGQRNPAPSPKHSAGESSCGRAPAASLFADLDRKRVRKCPTCVPHFFDTSKKGTRRWCSVQLCGNRLKVAAYAARHRHHTLT